MKTLRSKILLALVASTVLALLITAVVSRVMLQRGFLRFLEQQEETQLGHLAPELAALYRQHGSWAEFAQQPRHWMRMLIQARPDGVRPPLEEGADASRANPPAGQRPGIHNRAYHQPHQTGQEARRHPPQAARELWRRLFLLDSQRNWVAGARGGDLETARLKAIDVDGQVVGWVGFHAAADALGPEARQFLRFQLVVMLASLLIALLLATALGFLLARSLSRPVVRLRDTVGQLTAGEFTARAAVSSRDEIGELARRVNRLAETLEKNETARRRWTADIAHELRTPLAVLRGELDAIHDGVRVYDTDSLGSLREEVDHLSRLVDDLQTLALADAGALNLRPAPLDLAALTQQVLEAFAERFKAAGLHLQAQLPPALELQADAQRLRQLLHNLIENACRYTDAGGCVSVRLYAQDGFAVLRVEDSAPGVAPEARDNLFERFYRVEASRARSSGGSGLGLAICHNIVLAHGGEINASDSPLGGLAIEVRLPIDSETV